MRASVPIVRLPVGRVADLLAAARLHHAADRFELAQGCYDQLLAAVPDHPQAHFFRALLHFQQGNPIPALDVMHELAAAHPPETHFQLNLAVALESMDRLPEACAVLERALTATPGSAALHGELGRLLLRLGQLPGAATHLARALGADPTLHQAADALGLALHRLGQLERALVCFRKALTIEPGYATAHNNLGNLLDELGRREEAINSYALALQHDPAFVAAHSNQSNCLRSVGRFAEAEASARRALAIDPAFPDALLNLGNVLKEQGRLEAAAEIYNRLLALHPEHAGARNNLGEIRKEQGRLAEAAAAYSRVLELQPGFSAAFSNLLYLHAFSRDISPEAERELSTGWEQGALSAAERADARHRALVTSGVFSALPRAGRPLRLGVVSAELGTHAVAEFLEPILQQLDRTRIHLTLFPTTARSGPCADRLRSLADGFVSLVGVPDAAAAHRIRLEKVDVLIDTTGHTANCRLGIFAHRAAPVQCTYIGYWSTTGLTEMDYFLSDPDAQPSTQAHYTEVLWRLPRLAVCYRGDWDLPCDRWEPDPAGTLWLGSFNKYSKIREETLALWAGVLHALPEARLLLEDRTVDDSETHDRILATLADHGISPERLHFEPYVAGHQRHMALYNRIDLALDTLPFNSGTTAFDALWMGVPLVALEGTWTGGRMGSSLLKSLGRPEWIAQTPQAYAEIVRDLARALPHDVAVRRMLRQQQRERMARSPLCDSVTLTRALEDAFEAMHDRWLAGVLPHQKGPRRAHSFVSS